MSKLYMKTCGTEDIREHGISGKYMNPMKCVYSIY